MPRIARERSVKGEGIERNGEKERREERRNEAKCGEERRQTVRKRSTGRRKILGVGKTGERTEDIELKWPLGAHSSIPLSLP